MSQVKNRFLAQMPTLTLKGNNTGSTANPQDLTVAQVNAILPVFTSALNGLVPLSGGGTTNFLRADGTWTTPTIGNLTGPVTSVGTATAIANGALSTTMVAGTSTQVMYIDPTGFMGGD